MKNKTPLLLVATLSLAVASLAHAGKAERDFFVAEVAPALKTAASTLKQSCGCDVKMDVKQDSFQTVDHLRQVRYAAGTIVDNAPRYCNDAPSKARGVPTQDPGICPHRHHRFQVCRRQGCDHSR